MGASKVEFARRSSADPFWKALCSIVDKRDGRVCRVMKCLTLKEGKMVERIPSFNSRLDRAHLLQASAYPEFIYFSSNVARICHTLHMRLDAYQDLVTGDPIDANQRLWWCVRIAEQSTEPYNADVDYFGRLVEYIKKMNLTPAK